MIEPRRINVTVSAVGPLPNNIIQRVNGRDCIPGSTLKGALRSSVELYLAELQKKRGLSWLRRACIPADANSLTDDERALELKPVCAFDEQNPNEVCPCCYLFGAQGLVGFVSVGMLKKMGGRFQGEISVLWKDSLTGWEFGKSRRIGNVEVDPWVTKFNSEQLLNLFLLKNLCGIWWFGSKNSGLEVKIEASIVGQARRGS